MKIQLKIQNLRHPSIVPKPASGVHWILLFDTPGLDGAYHSRYLVRGGVHVLQGRPSITGRTQRHRRAIICAHTDSYDHFESPLI